MTASIQNFVYPSADRPSQIFCQDLFAASSLDLDGGIKCREQVADERGAVPTEDDLKNIFEKGRAQGYVEGCTAERSGLAAQQLSTVTQNAERAAKSIEELESLRSSYLQAMELEVVKLALSIASQILRREVQLDPLLLTNTVRIALAQVADKMDVRLRVPARQADLWSETMKGLPNLNVRPVIIADERLEDGECTLESDIGSADLGIRSQLLEISRILLTEPDPLEQMNIEAERRRPAVHA